MTKTVYVIGSTNESINACILLATLQYQVRLLTDDDSLQQVMNDYQFDRQMVLLWQLYQSQGNIVTQPLPTHDFSAYVSADDIWLFVDGVSAQALAQFGSFHFNPTTQIIISGVKAMGEIEQFARKLTTTWVYYLPFIFMKDGANFSSFSKPIWH